MTTLIDKFFEKATAIELSPADAGYQAAREELHHLLCEYNNLYSKPKLRAVLLEQIEEQIEIMDKYVSEGASIHFEGQPGLSESLWRKYAERAMPNGELIISIDEQNKLLAELS